MKVYLVNVFYDNCESDEDNYTASRVEKVFGTKEKATEYVENWQVPDDKAKVTELNNLVDDTDIRVIEVETEMVAYSGIYYFSVKEMEVE